MRGASPGDAWNGMGAGRKGQISNRSGCVQQVSVGRRGSPRAEPYGRNTANPRPVVVIGWHSTPGAKVVGTRVNAAR